MRCIQKVAAAAVRRAESLHRKKGGRQAAKAQPAAHARVRHARQAPRVCFGDGAGGVQLGGRVGRGLRSACGTGGWVLGSTVRQRRTHICCLGHHGDMLDRLAAAAMRLLVPPPAERSSAQRLPPPNSMPANVASSVSCAHSLNSSGIGGTCRGKSESLTARNEAADELNRAAAASAAGNRPAGEKRRTHLFFSILACECVAEQA